MKRSIIAMAIVACSLSAYAQKNIQSLELGSEIPMSAVSMSSPQGKNVSLDQAKTKKGLVVMFSCNTCPYVIKSQKRTTEVIAYAASKGIGMVIVNSNEAYRDEDDAPDAMKAYSTKQGYKVPYLIDKQSVLADAFGATRTPEVFLFDGNGKLVYKGAMEDNPSNPSESKQLFLKMAIDNMLAGKPIDPNSTKSIGCSIKRVM
ncbi:MAG TPA: thioredoxin family protein [Flavipsychrobacter sp.]|nr:thioredoxin family protein [Flavipsychrobacter sp.]